MRHSSRLIVSLAACALVAASIWIASAHRSAISAQETGEPSTRVRARRHYLSPNDGTGQVTVRPPLSGRKHIDAIVTAGHPGPRAGDVPLIELEHELLGPANDPHIRVTFPQPFLNLKHYQFLLVFESDSFFERIDEQGRHVFSFPRYPENTDYMLPPGHGIVASNRALLIKEREGRIVVALRTQSASMIFDMILDSSGSMMTVRTRLLEREE